MSEYRDDSVAARARLADLEGRLLALRAEVVALHREVATCEEQRRLEPVMAPWIAWLGACVSRLVNPIALFCILLGIPLLLGLPCIFAGCAP